MRQHAAQQRYAQRPPDGGVRRRHAAALYPDGISVRAITEWYWSRHRSMPLPPASLARLALPAGRPTVVAVPA